MFEKRQANEVVANIKSERKGKPETIILDGDEVCGTSVKSSTYLFFLF